MKERYDVDISENNLKLVWSAVVSIFLIGGVTGSFISSWLADRCGRKGALCFGNICGIAGALMFFLVRKLNSIELLLAGRLVVGKIPFTYRIVAARVETYIKSNTFCFYFSGLSGGLATSIVPMYMTEIAPLRLRGAVGVLCQLGLTGGVFFGQITGLETVLGTEDAWQYMLGAFVPLCVLALVVTSIILPESPKYLFIIKEQKQMALNG